MGRGGGGGGRGGKGGGGGGGALTAADIQEIREYTGTYAEDINRSMWGNEPLSATDLAKIDRLNAALDKLPVFNGTTVRDIGFIDGSRAATDFLKQHSVGSTVTYKGFTSTSKAGAVSKADDAKGSFHLVIKGKSGRSVSRQSLYKGEKEVLFKNNSKFKVVSRQQNSGGGWTITMEQL